MRYNVRETYRNERMHDMKKLGIIAALCCAFVLCFALVGCGGVDKSNYTGDWKLAYGSDENLDADSLELMDSLGLTVILTLNDDGTGTLNLFGDSMDATWEASSNEEGTIALDDSDASLKLSGGELTIEDSTGASMTFKRTTADSTASADSASASSASSEASSSSSAS